METSRYLVKKLNESVKRPLSVLKVLHISRGFYYQY